MPTKMKLSESELKKRLPCLAIGISNLCEIDEKYYGIQFYDMDKSLTKMSPEMFEEKKELIRKTLFSDRDCLMFRTKNGVHFVSFCIDFIHSLKYYRNRAKKLSKKLNENYKFKKKKYLVLRLSPKKKTFKNKITGEPRKAIISGRPKFLGVLSKPKKNMVVSSEHLKIYNHYIGLPSKVLQCYIDSCTILKTKIKLHTYRTR